MDITLIEEKRQELKLTKSDVAGILGISRVTYYSALKKGYIDDNAVFNGIETLGIQLPEDYYNYTSESLRANMNFHRVTLNDFKKLWGEEYNYNVMWALANGNKKLYNLKELFDRTFDPMIIPCEYKDGKYIPVKAPKYKKETER